MGKVIAGFSMSVDGFVAALNDSPEPHIFDWYGTGNVRFDWPGDDMESHVTPASAAYLRKLVEQTGALVVGRRVFDLTDGWAGRHPIGVPVFVVSHRGPEGWDNRHDPSLTTFVSGGVARAVEQAQAVAGGKWVGVAGPNIAQQCLDLVCSTRSESSSPRWSSAKASRFSPTSRVRPSFSATRPSSKATG
jgi:dihydrofolate reductase